MIEVIFEVTKKQLKQIEWSSYQMGMGFGFMDSGPGPWVPSCPVCKQIDPNFTGAGCSDFVDSAKGHKKSCWLGKALK